MEETVAPVRKPQPISVTRLWDNRWFSIYSPKLEPFYRKGARWLCKAVFHPEYYGFENLPKEGPALLIANHISYIDGLIIQCACDRPVRFIIDSYIYKVPGVHYFMKLGRAIPVEPKKHSVEEMLNAISEGLEAGDLICIFPEGQLTYTGNLGRFKPGIEWIIARDPVPVYPIALKGLWGSIFSRKYLRARWRFLPRRIVRDIKVICGAPIAPEKVTVNYLQRVIMQLKNSI